jgi:hypothetical protein
MEKKEIKRENKMGKWETSTWSPQMPGCCSHPYNLWHRDFQGAMEGL